MTSIPKNVYIDKLSDVVNEYSNAYHRKIKMKNVDKKDKKYTDFNKEVYDECPMLKVRNYIRISK